MYVNKSQRGRPRLNRPKIDRGTKELRQKKAMLLRNRKDSALAESLLGVLYARQLISKPLYEAGCFFGELGYRFEPCLGHKFRQNSSILIRKMVNGQKYAPYVWLDEEDEKRTYVWNKALKALKQAGTQSYKIVLDVVFYEQDLYLIPVLDSFIAYVEPLRRGLEFLEMYFREESQGERGRNSGLDLNPG